MPDWARAARDALAREPVAMVSVIAVEGSAPRGPGTRMIVTASEAHGSIGGGRLEWLALEQARKILDLPPGSWRVQDYPLGPLLGQCCGGRVRLLIDRLDPGSAEWLGELESAGRLVTSLGETTLERAVVADAVPDAGGSEVLTAGHRLVEALDRPHRTVWLFGAGHVGQAIMRAGADLPLDLRAFDTRELQDGSAAFATGEQVVELAGGARERDAVLVMTHDHGLDYQLVRAALEGQAGYVGLIGSATKRARFLSRLAKEGVAADRLTCPIGLPSVPGKEPPVIAIAVLAQLLALERAE